MGPATSRKRLRVRLKATDGTALAKTFGQNLKETGAFVPRLKKVQPGDAVRLELMYADGRLALAGNGSVAAKNDRGADLEIDWDDDAWPLLLEVLSTVAPTSGAEHPPIPDLDDRSATSDDVERAYETAMRAASVLEADTIAARDAPRPFAEEELGEWDDEPSWSEEPTAFMAPLPKEPSTSGASEASPWEDDDAATMLVSEELRLHLAGADESESEPKPEPKPEPKVAPRLELPSFDDAINKAIHAPRSVSRPDDAPPLSTRDIAGSTDLAVSGDVFASGDLPSRHPEVAPIIDPPRAPTPSPVEKRAPKIVTEEVDISQVLDEVVDGDEPNTLDPMLTAPTIPSTSQFGGLDLPIATLSTMDLISDLVAGPASQTPHPTPQPPPDPLDVALLEYAHEDATQQPSTEYSSSSGESVRPPADDLQAWGEDFERAPGEVTPLARIELVRHDTEQIRTGDVKPLMDDEPSDDTAIPSKRDLKPAEPLGHVVLGIDVGGAFVRTAVDDEVPRLLETSRGLDGVPSAVVIEASGKTTVGEPALRKLARHRGVHGTKRLIGRTVASSVASNVGPWLPYALEEDAEGAIAAKLEAHVVSLEEVTALLLKEAHRSADLALDDRTNRVVLTCPTAYGVRQRRALRTAAQLAGLAPERIVSGPLAVAVEHTRGDHQTPRRLMVVDFGASHLDVAVVEVDGAYRITHATCRADLGGVEFDRRIATRLAKEIEQVVQQPLDVGGDTMVRLVLAAQAAKQTLSTETVAHVTIDHPLAHDQASFNLELDLAREHVAALTEAVVERALEVCTNLAGLAGDLDEIVGVGGQLRDPAVRARFESALGATFVVVDAERTAVLGAARIGRAVAEGRPFELFERTATALGIIGPAGAPEPLLGANAACPTSGVRAWPVIDAGSQSCVIYEGFDGIEPVCRLQLGADRTPPFDAALKVSLDGAMELSVEAVDRASGAMIATNLVSLATPERRPVPVAPPDEAPTGLIGWLKRKFQGS